MGVIVDDVASVSLSCGGAVAAQSVIGWRSEPNCGRGSAGIIWNCLTVMVLASWSIIHLDTRTLPSPLSYKPLFQIANHIIWSPIQTLRGKKTLLYTNGTEHPSFATRKILQAFIFVFFPETGLVTAVEECITAWYIRRATRKIEGWERFSLRQAHLIAMGGFSLPEIVVAQDFDQYVLHTRMPFSAFPNSAQIALRAKKDHFDKAMALAQAVYFMGNCITRYRHGFSITFLEFLTLNYLVYAVLVAALQYTKPQELQDPFKARDADLDDKMHYFPSSEAPAGPADTATSPFYRWCARKTWYIHGLILCVILSAFALQFAYRVGRTNKTQSLLWKLSLAGSVMIVTLAFWPRTKQQQQQAQQELFDDSEKKKWWQQGAFVIGHRIYTVLMILGYAGLRMYILVLAFRKFGRAKAGEYVTAPSWTQYIGHVGG